MKLTAQYVEGVTTGKPIVKIGNDCGIGPFSHITGINKIRIGNCVRTGMSVLITDNSHGSFTRDQLMISPRKRPLVSSGEVVIGNNVWIGAKASILSGVHIGDGCVIGAGSVVTKDIPPYSMAVGVPARVVKQI